MVNINQLFTIIVIILYCVILIKLTVFKPVWPLAFILMAYGANLIYSFSPENMNSLADFLTNPAASLIFLTLIWSFWDFIAWVLGGELIPAPNTGGYDGGTGGGRRYYYRRHGVRVEDLRFTGLFLMFVFSVALDAIINLFFWLAGYGYNLNPRDRLGLILSIFSILINIPIIIYYFVRSQKALSPRKRGSYKKELEQIPELHVLWILTNSDKKMDRSRLRQDMGMRSEELDPILANLVREGRIKIEGETITLTSAP